MISTVIFVYAGTAPLAGFFGGSQYARFGGMWFVLASRATHNISVTFSCRLPPAVCINKLVDYIGKEWIKQTLLTACLVPVVVSTVVFLINFIAIYYQATRAIPFTTMVCMH
jgi:transmembrane 9 superfamily protein 3